MKRLFLVGLAGWMLAASTSPCLAALGEGDAAPDFKATASLAGKPFDFSLAETLKKGPVVVFFFPAAFTDVCNLQAHEFAMNQEKFVSAGATVLGISLDSIARLNEFSADPNYCGGKVAVASDAGGAIARSYELRVTEVAPGEKDSLGYPIEHGLVEGLVFVIRRDGRIAAAIGGSSPTSNVAKALAAVKKLAPSQTASSSPSP